MLKNADKFFKVYASLPLEERKKPIIILEEEPLTWALAYDEIENETKKGEKILQILILLEII